MWADLHWRNKKHRQGKDQQTFPQNPHKRGKIHHCWSGVHLQENRKGFRRKWSKGGVVLGKGFMWREMFQKKWSQQEGCVRLAGDDEECWRADAGRQRAQGADLPSGQTWPALLLPGRHPGAAARRQQPHQVCRCQSFPLLWVTTHWVVSRGLLCNS